MTLARTTCPPTTGSLPPTNIAFNTTATSVALWWDAPAQPVSLDYYQLVVYYKTVFLDKSVRQYTRKPLSPNRKYALKLRSYSMASSDDLPALAKYSLEATESAYTSEFHRRFSSYVGG